MFKALRGNLTNKKKTIIQIDHTDIEEIYSFFCSSSSRRVLDS